MKAISLHQPWASLIALGLKRVETRSWPTSYRGPLLVHAAKRWTAAEREVVARLRAADVAFRVLLPDDWETGAANPPLGAILAVVNVTDCQPMTAESIARTPERERMVGGWAPGRWAWETADWMRPVLPPIPLRGRQGLFEVAADEIEALSRACLVAAYEGARA